MRRWQSPIRGSFPGKKTEAAGSLPPPPNNGDKKKGNCLGLDLRGATAAQEAGRTNRYEEADDREERAHFGNRGEPADQSRFFEAALARIGVTPALIHVNVVVGANVGEQGSRDEDVDVAAAAAGVLIIIEHLVSAEIVAEDAERAVEEPVSVRRGAALQRRGSPNRQPV